ncbi:hypothetical protein DNF23_04325 [Pseudomonas syringae pv. pisi]|nr:hypothetical protein DND47_03665 [Pseudomonas syringae pv. syringae]
MPGICCRTGGSDQRQWRLSFPALRLWSAVHDVLWRKRTRSVQNGMRRRASHDNEVFAQTDAEL